jgi:hypothetical protein
MDISESKIIFIIFIVVIIFIICDMKLKRKKYRENLWVGQNPNINPNCGHVKKNKKPYVSSWSISNYSDAYDCYKDCIKSADCQYVGVGFDCYDNCFNNVVWPGNTLGDYNQ